MDARAWLEDRLPAFECALENAIPAATGAPDAAGAPLAPQAPGPEPGRDGALPPRLRAAMRHLLFPGGKRLRPALALAAAEAVGAPAARALPMAVAVELVHTYSLIHDDLPCMDDDDERRGRPSVHVAFGEATAVLAGDALLALAFEVLARADAPAEARADAVAELAAAAGAAGLVGGQVDDLAFAPAEADRRAVEWIHARKTAALFGAAIVGGARLAGADAPALASLRRCGRALGVAFQIADDLLDAGSDAGCSTLHVLGVDEARARAESLLGRALSETQAFGERAEPLRQLAQRAVRGAA